MAVLGTNSIFAAQYLPIGEASASTSNAGFTTIAWEPTPSGRYRPGWWRVKSETTQWLELDGSSGYVSVYWRNPDTLDFELLIRDETGAPKLKAGAGATYYVQVASSSPSGTASYTLVATPTDSPGPTWSVTTVGAPAGANAFASAPTAPLNSTSVSMDSASYSLEGGEQNLVLPDGDGASAWWQVTPPSTGILRLTVGRGYIAVMTGTTLGGLELVEQGLNELYVYVEAGTTYYLRWALGDDPSGTFNLVVRGPAACVTSTVTFDDPVPAFADSLDGAVIGGSGAVSDGSDATYLDLAPSGSAIATRANRFHVTPSAVALTDGAIIDVKVAMRAKLDDTPAGADRGPAAYLGNYTDDLAVGYGWLYDPTNWHMRLASARDVSGSLLVTREQLESGVYSDGAFEDSHDSMDNGFVRASGGTNVALPSGTKAGDLLVIGAGNTTTPFVTDARMSPSGEYGAWIGDASSLDPIGEIQHYFVMRSFIQPRNLGGGTGFTEGPGGTGPYAIPTVSGTGAILVIALTGDPVDVDLGGFNTVSYNLTTPGRKVIVGIWMGPAGTMPETTLTKGSTTVGVTVYPFDAPPVPPYVVNQVSNVATSAPSAMVSEFSLRTYLWDESDVDVKPPDVEPFILGNQRGNRARFYGEGK